MKRIGSSMLILMLISAVCIGQDKGPDLSKVNPKVLSQLTILRSIFVASAIDKQVDRRMKYYATNAICMPEYQQSLHGREAIRKYYQGIFERQQVKKYERVILEVHEMKKTIVEIGTFKIQYTDSTSDKVLSYAGKYWNIWGIDENGSLLLKAETWGYFHGVKSPAALIVKIPDEYRSAANPATTKLDKNIAFELKALNALMEKGVRYRDAVVRGDFFTSDAIFMPFADSMKVGISNIRHHLVQYNSGNVKIDSINIYNRSFEVNGNYILEYPQFYVEWKVGKESGISQGKGIRIWRREQDCSLKIWREIGTHTVE